MFSELSIMDFGILLVVLVSIITGFFRGFVRELFSIALWALALWLAAHYSHLLSTYLKPWIAQDQLRSILAFVAVAAVLIIFGGLMVSMLSYVIRKSGLSGTDRLLGLVFGFFRAIFVVALIVVAMNFSGISIKEYESQSKFYPQFKPLVTWMESFIPQWMNQIKQFDPSSHNLVMATEVKSNLALNDFNHLS